MKSTIEQWRTADGVTHFKVEVTDARLRELDAAEVEIFEQALRTLRGALDTLSRVVTGEGVARTEAPQIGPHSYPDAIESPLDPPTVSGTNINKPI